MDEGEADSGLDDRLGDSLGMSAALLTASGSPWAPRSAAAGRPRAKPSAEEMEEGSSSGGGSTATRSAAAMASPT